MVFVFVGREFFVGLSSRTNIAGVRALAAAFPGYPCTPVKVFSLPYSLVSQYTVLIILFIFWLPKLFYVQISGALHLKGLMTMAGPDMICASKTKECEEVLKVS